MFFQLAARVTLNVPWTKHVFKENVKILACLKTVESMQFVNQTTIGQHVIAWKITKETPIDTANHMSV